MVLDSFFSNNSTIMSKKVYLAVLVYGLTTLLITQPKKSLGQLSKNVKIDKVDLIYKDDKVYVPYSIINSSSKDRYVVWVDFFNEKDEKINAKTITGDINYIVGFGDKQICWDIKNDGYITDEKIYAKVSAKLIPAPSLGKAIVHSTAFPGWGDYQYKSDKRYWIRGALGYSLIGASTYWNLKAANSLNKYKKTDIPSSQDKSYSDAKNYAKVSSLLAAGAIVVWTWDYISVIRKSSKNKSQNTDVVISDPSYKLYISCSIARRINSRGLPPNLFAELNFTDENNNGLLEAREKANLDIILSNQGKGDAVQLEVSVTDSTLDKSMVIGNSDQKINLIKSGESIKVSIPITTDIDLKVATHKLTINVTEGYGYDMDPAYLVLDAVSYQPPQLVFSGLEIIDSGAGTGAIKEDGQLQAGEQVKAKVVVQNVGKNIAKNIYYIIKTSDPNVYLDNSEGTIGNLSAGEVKEFYFTLSPNKRVNEKGNLPIFLTLKDDLGMGNLNDFQLPIALNQRPPEPNIVTVKSNIEASSKRNVARFEYTSNKFKTNISNIINIKTVVSSSTKRPNSVGVIFGISNYKELPPAPYADNDAKIVKEYFEKVLGVEQVIVYTNDQVSGFIFDDVFNPDNGELQRAIAKGETEVYVFYSGHGIPDKSGENIYLFPSDGKISRLETQGYNIEKLYQNLSKLEAKHVTVIIDACFSGGSRKTEKIQTENLIAQKGVKVRPKNSWFNDSNFTIINSSTGDETSLGFDATETGLFTYYLCVGLQGKADANNDKVITLGELKSYLIKNVTETSRKISGLQTPIFSGDENIVLTTYK